VFAITLFKGETDQSIRFSNRTKFVVRKLHRANNTGTFHTILWEIFAEERSEKRAICSGGDVEQR